MKIPDSGHVRRFTSFLVMIKLQAREEKALEMDREPNKCMERLTLAMEGEDSDGSRRKSSV
jgi:hypothetical protein